MIGQVTVMIIIIQKFEIWDFTYFFTIAVSNIISIKMNWNPINVLES
jgi:hypothetical protein